MNRIEKIDCGDNVLFQDFSRGSISTIRYVIGYKRLNAEMPDSLSPFYPGPRDMD
ncbi:MAG: hypothetical protein KAU17_05065 [Spirochaetales bacterium]|nr:hypothetical protein [Spirochaetales bacterium]